MGLEYPFLGSLGEAMIKICENCKESYEPRNKAGIEFWRKQKFCSLKCSAKYSRGRPNSGRFKKGLKRPDYSEEKSPTWKGEKAGYSALHYWIRNKLGRPSICFHCKRTDQKRYEWANISGKYKRDVTDWIRLCKKCHTKLDDSVNKSWKTRNKKGG